MDSRIMVKLYFIILFIQGRISSFFLSLLPASWALLPVQRLGSMGSNAKMGESIYFYDYQ